MGNILFPDQRGTYQEPMSGLIDLHLPRVERGKVAPLSWPPRAELKAARCGVTERVTQTGMPCCAHHAKVLNLSLREPYRPGPLTRWQYCSFAEER